MDNNQLFQKFIAFTASVHQITNDITKDVNSDGLTPLQYKIIEYIAVSQPVTLSEISDCMNISMPNTSRELKKLSEKGLCTRITDPADRRKQEITLSAAGGALMNEAFSQIAVRFEQRIAGLTAEERKETEQALDLLHKKVFY